MKEFDTPYTPAHTLILALRTALRRIKDEGIENVWQRHRRMSEACQAGVQALGLELFSSRPAEGLTAFRVPEGLKDTQIRNKLAERFGITTVGGQAKLKGQDRPDRPHGLHRRDRRHRHPGRPRDDHWPNWAWTSSPAAPSPPRSRSSWANPPSPARSPRMAPGTRPARAPDAGSSSTRITRRTRIQKNS